MASGSEHRALEKSAQEFARDLSSLLNRTVSHGTRISAVAAADGTVVAGCGVTRSGLDASPIPLCLSGSPRAYLSLSITLKWDDEHEYLAVKKSRIGLAADKEARDQVVRFEYIREPSGEYPEAHTHVHGKSDALAEIRRRGGLDGGSELKDLHLPVGGRRFRPTLEDVVEFLIVEGLVDARDGWDEAVREGRQGWEKNQLKAAVRRDPDSAREVLDET